MAIRLLLGCWITCALVSQLSAAASYDAAGRLTRSNSPTGARITYTYDAAGNITAMTVTAPNGAAPVLISEPALVGETGVDFHETLLSSKPGTTFTANGLPAGLSLDSATGELSGIPTAAGVSQVAVTLTAAGQSSNASVSIQIRPAAAILWVKFAGNYTGTALAPTSASTGLAAVTITPGGGCSGSVMFKGQKISFSGVFSPTGVLSQSIARSGLPSLLLTLAFSQADETVTGTIGDGSTSAEIELRRARLKGDDATWQIGAWTFLLSPGSGTGSPPTGTGYGVITTTKSATGTWVTSFADGTKASGSLILGRKNQATILKSLYLGRGSLAGDLSFADAPLLSGRLHWSRQTPTDLRFPAFELPVSLTGSRFIARPAGTRQLDFADTLDNARIVIAGLDSQPLPIVFTLNIGNRGTFPIPNPHTVSFSISAAGLFSGAFTQQEAGGPLIRFSGAILQSQRRGGGFYLGSSIEGSIDLLPNP